MSLPKLGNVLLCALVLWVLWRQDVTYYNVWWAAFVPESWSQSPAPAVAVREFESLEDCQQVMWHEVFRDKPIGTQRRYSFSYYACLSPEQHPTRILGAGAWR